MILKVVGATALAGLIVASGAAAQQKGVSRTDLSRHDLTDPGHEAIQVEVTLEPKAEVPRHTHPGEEIVYVLRGVVEYRLEGQKPARLKRGDTLFIPYGVIHSVKNVGAGPATEIATYLVTKGKPLLQPAE
ncbi:MAG: cupin domain-containing protein [Sphingomicrobium sp.]